MLLEALPNFLPISAALPRTMGPPRLEVRNDAAGTPVSSDFEPTGGRVAVAEEKLSVAQGTAPLHSSQGHTHHNRTTHL